MTSLPEEIQKLKETFKIYEYKDHNNTKFRSSVAIILRENKEIKNEKNKLEILYILRQFRPKDEWSGHVGFPGGIKNKNESDKDAAEREVSEELGIDLSKTEFIGRLNTHIVKHSILLVSPFVYFTKEPLEMTLNPKEVRDVRWVPISFLVSEKPEKLFSQVSFSIYLSIPGLRDLFGEDGLTSMKGMYLQTFEYMNGDKTIKNDFFLWGLTIRMTNSLMKLMGHDEICSELFYSNNIKLVEALNKEYQRSKL